MSLGVVIYESVRPQVLVLWRVPGTKIYRSIDQETVGHFVPNVLIVRLTAALYFANMSYVKDKLEKYIVDMSRADIVKYVVLEMTSVLTVDCTAAHAIRDIVSELRSGGIQTLFAMVGSRAMRTFENSGLVSFIGEDMFCHTVDDAVRKCMMITEQRGIEARRSSSSSEEEPTTGPAKRVRQNVTFVTQPEVGISNDMHRQFTQVHLVVPYVVADLVNMIMAAFASLGVNTEGAQVDHTCHTYQIVKEERKLNAKEIEELQNKLDIMLRRVFSTGNGNEAGSSRQGSPHRTLNGNGADRTTLEQALAEERAKIIAGELAKERAKALEAALAELRV